MSDNFEEEYDQKMNVLDLDGLEPIVKKLYSLKQQDAKVNYYFTIVFS